MLQVPQHRRVPVCMRPNPVYNVRSGQVKVFFSENRPVGQKVFRFISKILPYFIDHADPP
jgi:hypothetical protein